MLSLFQNRFAFALMLIITVIGASLFAFAAFNLGRAPRTYVDIITTPTFTPGPQTPTRVPTALPTLAPLPTNTRVIVPPTPPLAFADNFTATKYFSLTWSSPNARATISNSIYTVHFSQPDTAFTLLQNFTLPGDDFSIHVDARAANISRADYGLLLWHGKATNGDERYIFFVVSPDGSYRITTQWTSLASNSVDLTPRAFSRVVRNGLQTNSLRVDGHGSRLIFFINDVQVSDLSGFYLAGFQSSFTQDGQVGLYVIAQFANLDVQFSNFKLFSSQ